MQADKSEVQRSGEDRTGGLAPLRAVPRGPAALASVVLFCSVGLRVGLRGNRRRAWTSGGVIFASFSFGESPWPLKPTVRSPAGFLASALLDAYPQPERHTNRCP